LQPGRGDGLAVKAEARVFDGDALDAAGAQHATEQDERLGEAGGDEHPLGRGGDAAHPAEVAGQRCAQLERAVGPRVVQRRVGRGRERGAVVAQPVAAGKARRIGQATDELRRGRPLGARDA